MIEVEQTAEPFAPADGAGAVLDGRRRRRSDESIADALVVALEIVVHDIFGDEESEMPLAKRNHAAQTLASNGSDEALREGVEVRAPRRQADAAHAGSTEQQREIEAKHRVAVVDQEAGVFQKPVHRIQQAARGCSQPAVMKISVWKISGLTGRFTAGAVARRTST